MKPEPDSFLIFQDSLTSSGGESISDHCVAYHGILKVQLVNYWLSGQSCYNIPSELAFFYYQLQFYKYARISGLALKQTTRIKKPVDKILLKKIPLPEIKFLELEFSDS